jgi:DeoR family fructose operon transcriptional repressor
MREETRLHRICALLSTLNSVSTEMIIQHLGVSRETVRRDVLKLKAQGRLRRIHGGVISCDFEQEPPLSVRNTVREREKRAIADATVKQLHAGQTLFIDSGSTTSLLAESLLTMAGLSIITNSLDIAGKLSSSSDNSSLQHEVILLGGQMGKTAQATSGENTIYELSKYRADIALLSPVGLSAGTGASSFFHHEAAIATAMVKYAKATYIMADSGKLGITSRVVYATPSQIDRVITNTKAETHPDFDALHQEVENIVIA